MNFRKINYLISSVAKAHIWPCLQDSAFSFDPIFMKLADNQNRHKISDEFENWPDSTDYRSIICPWMLKKPTFDIVSRRAPKAL